jgi:hypothetical protein
VLLGSCVNTVIILCPQFKIPFIHLIIGFNVTHPGVLAEVQT